jgi:hypothetical protein
LFFNFFEFPTGTLEYPTSHHPPSHTLTRTHQPPSLPCQSLCPTTTMDERRQEAPHPRNGGCAGYDPTMRAHALDMKRKGLAADMAPSKRSARRWEANNSPLRRKKRQGSKRRHFVGIELLLLALFRAAWPKSTGDDVSAFMFEQTGTDVPTNHTTCQWHGFSRCVHVRRAHLRARDWLCFGLHARTHFCAQVLSLTRDPPTHAGAHTLQLQPRQRHPR